MQLVTVDGIIAPSSDDETGPIVERRSGGALHGDVIRPTSSPQ
jgi:hypothetical protein